MTCKHAALTVFVNGFAEQRASLETSTSKRPISCPRLLEGPGRPGICSELYQIAPRCFNILDFRCKGPDPTLCWEFTVPQFLLEISVKDKSENLHPCGQQSHGWQTGTIAQPIVDALAAKHSNKRGNKVLQKTGSDVQKTERRNIHMSIALVTRNNRCAFANIVVVLSTLRQRSWQYRCL